MYKKFYLFFLLNFSLSMQASCFHRNIEQQIISQDASQQPPSILSLHLKEPHFYVIQRDPNSMHKLVIHELPQERYPSACAQLLTKRPTYPPFVYVVVVKNALPLLTPAKIANLSYHAVQKTYQIEQAT